MIGDGFDDVLARAKGGDRRAVEVIYRDLAPLVLGYLRGRRVRDPEDVAGEVFVSLVHGLDSFEGSETKFRSWVLTITHRRIVDDIRHRGRRIDTVPDPDDAIASVAADELTDTAALEGIDADSVASLLDVLTDDQRAVVTLRIVADLPIKEVSAILDKPITAVKSLQHRALATLAKELSRRGGIPDPGSSDH